MFGRKRSVIYWLYLPSFICFHVIFQCLCCKKQQQSTLHSTEFKTCMYGVRCLVLKLRTFSSKQKNNQCSLIWQKLIIIYRMSIKEQVPDRIPFEYAQKLSQTLRNRPSSLAVRILKPFPYFFSTTTKTFFTWKLLLEQTQKRHFPNWVHCLRPLSPNLP